MLLSIHGIGASLLKTPELAIDEGEAKMLASAVSEVSKHYEVLSKVSGEAVAWTHLISVCAIVYGPRIFAVRNRRPQREEPAQVTFPFGGAS